MSEIKNIFKCRMIGTLSLALFVAGCAGTRTVDPALTKAHLSSSNYMALAANYMKDGKPNYDKDSLLDTLEAGKAFNDAGLWKESREAFELASQKMAWKADTVDTPSAVANLIGTTLTSSAFGTYQGKIYEGGLIDYYQAINSIMLNDESGARVDFNRFDDRMTNAQRQFASYKRDLSADQQKQIKQPEAVNSQKSYTQVKSQIDGGVSDIPGRQSESMIRISAGQFMSGIFRATSSAKQDKDADRVLGPINAARTAASTKQAADLSSKVVNQLKADKYESKGKVYILYEDGRGPSFSEFRVDLPLFLVSSNVTYSGIALPKFVPGQAAFRSLSVSNTPTVEFTNITNISGMDFSVSYPSIVTKAITSTIIKTAAQYVANTAIDAKTKDNQLGGALLKMGVGAAQAATTKADVRSWANLPNTIQIAVVNKPSTGVLTVSSPSNQKLLDITLPESPNSLVLIKASGTEGKPAYYVKALPTQSSKI